MVHLSTGILIQQLFQDCQSGSAYALVQVVDNNFSEEFGSYDASEIWEKHDQLLYTNHITYQALLV